jgi:hypothetical protein
MPDAVGRVIHGGLRIFSFPEKMIIIHYLTHTDYSIERCIADVAKGYGKYYMIPERDPVPGNYGTRFEVKALGWTMQHDLQANLKFMEEFYKNKK